MARYSLQNTTWSIRAEFISGTTMVPYVGHLMALLSKCSIGDIECWCWNTLLDILWTLGSECSDGTWKAGMWDILWNLGEKDINATASVGAG